MSLALALMTTITLGASPEAGMSRQQLAQLIHSAQEDNCRDASFDFEGRQGFPTDARPNDLTENYTGRFRRRADGAMQVDSYRFEQLSGKARHDVVAILEGTTGYSSRKADRKDASITFKKQGPLEYAGTGNYRKIWLADQVEKLAESPYQYEYEGIQRVDGEECVVARFRLTVDDSIPKDKTVSLLFWVDLKRGGHVVRHEQRHRGENLAGLTIIRLGRFERGRGRVAWLPISGRAEGRMTSRDGKRVFLDTPVFYETYDMNPVTLRLDGGLEDDAFKVEARAGDSVSDELRKAKYEFGQYMVRSNAATRRPTDAEIKTNLDRMLKDSAVMAHELKASSPLREGPGWTSYWPWAVAGLATAGAGFLYYKSRNPSQP